MSRINRRNFLAASAAGLVAPQILARAEGVGVGANDQIRVGLIGCGGMGRGDLEAFLANKEVVCPAVCDVDENQLATGVRLVEGRRGTTPDAVKDFRLMLDRDDLDAVIVGTPDHWHALPTVMAAQAGLDVYCEKPLAKSIGEGAAMKEAVRRHNTVAQMGTQWRSGEHYREAVEFIQSGKLGKIRLVRAWAYLDWIGGIGNPPNTDPPPGVDYDMWLGPAPDRPFNPNRFHFNFRWFWDYAGGLMTDWGVHLLNVCLWAMGPEWPTSVTSSGGKHALADNTETPDTQIAVYDFPSYTLVWEHAVKVNLGPNGRQHGMSFTGDNGTLLIDDRGWQITPERKQEALEGGLDPVAEEPVFARPAIGGERPAHVRNFLDCMATREQPVEHFDLAHHVSSVAHLGNVAFLTGDKIRWDAEKGEVVDNPAAASLVTPSYREPWSLPYMA